MNKQELQTMIDSTIVPNKKKGITAESLRLVLKEMATATPEGGSDVEILTVYGANYNELYEFNPDTIEACIDGLQNEYPTLNIKGGNLHNYYLDALKNNASVYKRLVENAGKKDLICKCSMGQEVLYMIKDILNPIYEQQFGFKPYDEDEIFLDAQVLLSYQVFNSKYTEEGKSNLGLEDRTGLNLSIDAGGDSANMTLHPDGSLSWEFIEQEATSSSDLVKRIWVDEAIGLEPTEEHIAENKATYEFFKNGGGAALLLVAHLDDGMEAIPCNQADLFEGVLQATYIIDDNWNPSVPNLRGGFVIVYDDGTIELEFKSPMTPVVYLPDEGEDLDVFKKSYNYEVYDIISRGCLASPITINAKYGTYTSSIVSFENEEARIVFVAGFDTNTGVAYMGKMSIQSDGTAAILQ